MATAGWEKSPPIAASSGVVGLSMDAAVLVELGFE